MEWWNDLWLNEGFAKFMEFISLDIAYPELHVVRNGSTFFCLLKCRIQRGLDIIIYFCFNSGERGAHYHVFSLG